jgi:hypothetical protein
MWSGGVVVRGVFAEDLLGVAGVVDQDVVEAFAAAGADPAFDDRVCLGAWIGESRILAPRKRNTSSKTAVNFASRSRRMNLIRSASPSWSVRKLRACWAVQAAVGAG